MDINSIQIRIGLRLGCNICTTHTFLYESLVTLKGLHALSCQKSVGKYQRYTKLIDVIIYIPSTLEPTG